MLHNHFVVSENKSKKAEKTSATTATQTPTVSGDASSESSVGNVVVVTKKSAVVSAESMANGGNMSQKGIGEKVNGESGGGGGMKEKKINLKVLPSPTSHMYCAIIKEASIIMDTVMGISFVSLLHTRYLTVGVKSNHSLNFGLAHLITYKPYFGPLYYIQRCK